MRASAVSVLYGLMLSIGLAACMASVKYTAKPVPAPTAGAMHARVTEKGVTVGVDPYTQVERQEAFFGLRLARMGVLPVQVFIRNDQDRAFLVRPYEMALLLPDGRAVAPVGAAAAVARGMGAPVRFSQVGRSAVSTETLAGAYAGPQAYGATSSVAALAGVVLMGEIGTQRELYRQLFTDYSAKELSEITLKRGESGHGFVYFIFPPDTTFPADMTLAIRVIDTESAVATIVEVPLSRLDLRGRIDEQQ